MPLAPLSVHSLVDTFFMYLGEVSCAYGTCQFTSGESAVEYSRLQASIL